MKRLLISVALIFLSSSINAAISQSGITDLKQLNGGQIIELTIGNTLTGYISEGQFQGKIAVTYNERKPTEYNGTLVMFFVPDAKLYYGKWETKKYKSCIKGINVSNFTCYYWFTGIKDGDNYVYVKRNGQIIFQFHKIRISNNPTISFTAFTANAEEKKKADAKKAEERKIAFEKKKREKEKVMAELEIKKEKSRAIGIIDDKKRSAIIEEAKIKSKNNPGFKDLRPGMPYSEYTKICSSNYCYGLNFYTAFETHFSGPEGRITLGKHGVKLLTYLGVNMGEIGSDGSFLYSVHNRIESESSIYQKMKKTFNAKYVKNFAFSERDRELFNEGKSSDLWVVYSDGQVALKITRVEPGDPYSPLLLFVEYRDYDQGKYLVETHKPITITLDDF